MLFSYEQVKALSSLTVWTSGPPSPVPGACSTHWILTELLQLFLCLSVDLRTLFQLSIQTLLTGRWDGFELE